MFEAETFQPKHSGIGGLRVVRSAEHQRQRDVFDCRQFGEQLPGLEDEAEGVAAQHGAVLIGDAGELVGAIVAHMVGDLAGRGQVDAGKNVQQRGFAGAGRAHDGDRFADVETKTHVVERRCGVGERTHRSRADTVRGLASRRIVHDEVGCGDDRPASGNGGMRCRAVARRVGVRCMGIRCGDRCVDVLIPFHMSHAMPPKPSPPSDVGRIRRA